MRVAAFAADPLVVQHETWLSEIVFMRQFWNLDLPRKIGWSIFKERSWNF